MFYPFVLRRFHALFWPVLTATICLLLLLWKDQAWLCNSTAPYGLFSLETGRQYRQDTAILASWKDSVPNTAPQDFCALHPAPIVPLHIAQSDAVLNYFLILFYTAGFMLLVIFLDATAVRRHAVFSGVLLGLLLFAALCAYIENWGLSNLLSGAGSGGLVALIPTLAIVKLVVLGMLTLYILFVLFFQHPALPWFTGYLRQKTLQLFQYRVIVLGIVFFTLPIWFMDQGQDLLVNSNAGDPGILLLTGVVLVAAALNWYLAKLFFGNGYRKGDPLIPLTPPTLSSPEALQAEKKVSRFLGVATILLPATAILNALQAIRMPYWLDQFHPATWLIGLLLLFFVLIRFDLAFKGYTFIRNRWEEKIARIIFHSIIVLLALGLPLLIRFVVLGSDHRSPYSLNFLFLQLVLLALAFHVFVSVRETLYPNYEWLGKRIGGPIILAAALLASAFLLYNIFPFYTRNWSGCYLSLPIFFSGIIFYTLAIVVLLRLGLAKGVNILLFLTVIGVALAIKGNNHYHDVHRIAVKKAPQRVSVYAYFKAWLLQRQRDIDSVKGEYPVFLVNSYGGGIRSAAYTNMVLSYLDDTLIRQGGFGKGFEHYVFSISGASGGAVGGAVQCAYRAIHADTVAGAYAHYRSDFETFYQHDFLTPVLSNMLGSDTWASPLGISFPFWRDRSAIQEELWARDARDSLKLSLDTEYNALWDTSVANPARYEVPLLFANTLNVDDGCKGICAPVDLAHRDFPGTIFVRERIDDLNAHRDAGEDSLQSISLITGAFLGARFPYMSPSGKMGAGYHFMDAGPKDNSAASTSEDIFLALAKWGMDSTRSDPEVRRLLHRVHFYFVSISNNFRVALDEQPDPRQLVSNRWEPISPIVGIINSAIVGNGTAADSSLRLRYSGALFPGDSLRADYCAIWPTASCIVDDEQQRYCPLLPLGWQISSPSLTRIGTCFTPGNIRCNPAGIYKVMQICRRL